MPKTNWSDKQLINKNKIINMNISYRFFRLRNTLPFQK